ncbi:MAG: hypothetical protein ACYC6Y_04265 [Thermoguttaceae bacterium]
MLRPSVLFALAAFVLCRFVAAQDVSKPASHAPGHRNSAVEVGAPHDRPADVGVVAPLSPFHSSDDPFASPPHAVAAASVPVELDILIACVAFDEHGVLRVKNDGAQSEANRAGSIAFHLAAKLNDEKDGLPPGISAGAAGANFLLQKLAGAGTLRTLEQFRLRASADGSKVFLQNGRRVPRVTGSTATGTGRVNSVSLENVGAIVTGSVQVVKPGRLWLTLQIERSGLAPEDEGTPVSVSEGTTIRAPQIDTLSINTQVSVPDRQSVVLTSLVQSLGDKVTETFVIVTATIVEPEQKAGGK